jgi:hypothetical protein
VNQGQRSQSIGRLSGRHIAGKEELIKPCSVALHVVYVNVMHGTVRSVRLGRFLGRYTAGKEGSIKPCSVELHVVYVNVVHNTVGFVWLQGS